VSNGDSAYGGAGAVIDGDFDSRYLSRVVTGSNGDPFTNPAIPGSTIELDLSYNNETINSFGIIWGSQGGYSALPTSFKLRADTGAGFFDVGTYSPNPTTGNGSDRMYINFSQLVGVDTLQVVVNDSDLPANYGIAIYEAEAFSVSIPEPACLGLVSVALPLLISRTRRKA